MCRPILSGSVSNPLHFDVDPDPLPGIVDPDPDSLFQIPILFFLFSFCKSKTKKRFFLAEFLDFFCYTRIGSTFPEVDPAK